VIRKAEIVGDTTGQIMPVTVQGSWSQCGIQCKHEHALATCIVR